MIALCFANSGGAPVFRPCLIGDWLEFIGGHFYSGALVDHLYRQNKSQAVSLLHQNALHSLHRTIFDAHFIADCEFLKWLNSMPAKVRAEELNVRICNRRRALAVADNPER